MTTGDGGGWRDLLGEGLAVTLELPVAPSQRPLTANDSAARLLDAIAALEDGPQGSVKDDPPSPEFLRLELKIDLLTDLVSTLLADGIPNRVRVRISGEGLVLPADALPTDSDRVEFYPCHWLARPVVLELGPIRRCGEECGASWYSPDHGLRDALARWVFRMHRREVARRRLLSGAVRADAVPSVSGPMTDSDKTF